MVANAISTATGSTKTFTYNGYTFKAYNKVTTGKNAYGNPYATAYTSIQTSDASTLSGGFCGVYPQLFNSSGVLSGANNDWTYNSSGSSGVGASTLSIGIPTNVSYYSYGLVRVWNGNGYTTFQVYGSPSLSDFT